ncbi:MAG: hypothetical protein KJT03_11915, partial [Verrucomicrobiae bacterium]|nr:hypothetical protein [Verrucomicrobiae bacterium]
LDNPDLLALDRRVIRLILFFSAFACPLIAQVQHVTPSDPLATHGRVKKMTWELSSFSIFSNG